MSKESLTADQLLAAKQLDKTLKSLTNVKEQLKDYKLGGIYILEEWTQYDPKNIFIQKTSMGFPTKYKVVYVTDSGIPYLRRITSTGNPTGDCYVPPEAKALSILKNFASGTHFMGDANQRFVPDPEQMDAILLQEEFDPMAQHAEKSKLYNEINKHNKRIAIPTGWSSFQKIADFFKSLNPGDKFWTSPEKQFVIQSIAKVGREYEIKCTDINQATVTFNFSYFNFKRLYKEQPRSFKKESA